MILRADVDAQDVATALDKDGFVCLDNALSADWVERARAYVRTLIEENGERYFSLNWPSRQAGSPPAELTSDPGVRALLNALVVLGCPRAETEDEIYTVLRVISGGEAASEKQTLQYHYDNTVITALAPIFIPAADARRSGELLAYPNRRRYRSSALLNIAEKAVVQSDWYRRRTTARLPGGAIPEIRELKPGNLYLFWGYRTYHANFPVAPGALRATLLLHHGDPHPGNLALRYLKRRNLRRERRNLHAGAAA